MGTLWSDQSPIHQPYSLTCIQGFPKGWPHYRPVRPDAFNGVFGAADVLLASIPAVCEAALAGSCPEENSTGFGCMLSRPTSAFCLIFKPNIRPFCILSSCKGLRCISYKNEKRKREKETSLSCTKLKPPVSLEHNLLGYLSESGSEHANTGRVLGVPDQTRSHLAAFLPVHLLH